MFSSNNVVFIEIHVVFYLMDDDRFICLPYMIPYRSKNNGDPVILHFENSGVSSSEPLASAANIMPCFSLA